MKQNCFTCHAEQMGKGGGAMIAPPMIRVQEHYKPLYPKKEDFVKAVSEWVRNPQKEKTNMPGAVRKFNLMAPLKIDEKKLTSIAEALFDAKFGKAGKGMGKGMGNKKEMHSTLKLNDGKKWKLKPASIQKLKEMNALLVDFKSVEVKEYQGLGSALFEGTKPLLLEKEYEGELFDQLHAFFASIEGSMHKLMSVKSTEEGDKYIRSLKEHFSKFPNYFE